MRLLLFSTEFPPGPGGLGRHAYEVAKHLNSFGWEVFVLTVQDYASRKEIETFNSAQKFQIVSVKRLPSRPLTALYRMNKARKMVKALNPDVLLVSGDSAIQIAAPLARIFRKSLVVVSHGSVPNSWQYRWWHWSHMQSKALICVSEYTKNRMARLGIHAPSTIVITNGADPASFKILPEDEVRDFRLKLAPENARILLTVGHVTHRKAQDVVIRALPRILKNFPNTHYYAVGLPLRKAEFLKLAVQLGVSEHVHFPGAVDPSLLLRYLNSCDVFVMVSRHTQDQWEGYGIAVVEAALCGKPSVVSANSGVTESIIPGKTGLKVDEEDVDATADAILQLLENDALRKSMGNEARITALQTSTWNQQVRYYDQVLREIAFPETLQEQI